MFNPRLALLRWKIEAHAWLEAIWEDRRFGITLTGCCTAICIYLQWRVPGPGVSVAFMGAAAALMTARAKATGTEKCLWMLIITALLLSEVLAIRKDRREHDEQLARLLSEEVTARGEAKSNFAGIGAGIKATITQNEEHFDSTMAAFSTTIRREEQTIKNTEPHAIVRFKNILGVTSTFPIHQYHRVQFNVNFYNVGNEDAERLTYDARAYVGKVYDKETQQKLITDFDKWWQSSPHQHTVELSPQVPAMFSFSTNEFTDEEIKSLMKRETTLYFIVRFVYSDHSGRWASDECFGVQDPSQNLDLAHACIVPTKHRYRATKDF